MKIMPFNIPFNLEHAFALVGWGPGAIWVGIAPCLPPPLNTRVNTIYRPNCTNVYFLTIRFYTLLLKKRVIISTHLTRYKRSEIKLRSC